MATVLFVCLHNAGRSQMSAALLEREAAGRRDEIARRVRALSDELDRTQLAAMPAGV
jgi:protein-tyrosine-phosphatase